MRYRVMLLGLVVPALLVATPFDSAQGQQPEQPLPRFRAGANLVRTDVYVSKDGTAVTDLTPDDFIVYEDDKPQQVESFELIRARGPNPQSERVDPTTARDMRQEMQDSARVFTLFFDRMFVQLWGSYHARQPVIQTLDAVIGPDDLVGAMTSNMAPTAVTYGRRTGSIESFLTETWHWGERMRTPTVEHTPPEIRGCLWAMDDNPIRRKYDEQQTLQALRSLVDYLDGLRPERKFVMIFTEGWQLFGADRVGSDRLPVTDRPVVDPRTGGLRRPEATDPGTNYRSDASCDRIQAMLALQDHKREFHSLLQLANRANVSFYPIDTRGLIVCDNMTCDGGMAADNAQLRERRNHLYDMASQTDGQAVLDAGNVAKTMQKVFADVGSYYLLGYYSTNQRLDGRFRRIRVEVKRPNADVRSRPGYLAPTEAEARAASAVVDKAAAARAAVPPTVSRALDSLTPTRGSLPVRIQAAGGPGSIGAIVEIDPATLKQPEWMTGGTMRVSFERDGSAAAGRRQVSVAIDPGQRSVIVEAPDTIEPGKYVVRAELMPRGARSPLQVSTPVEVVATDAAVGSAALAYRRGPSTGLAYVPTADARFRRTERLRIEVPVASGQTVATGRLLTRDGKPMPLAVTYQPRRDDAKARWFGVGEVILSPLAAGEYVLELAFAIDGTTSQVAYGFRIIP